MRVALVLFVLVLGVPGRAAADHPLLVQGRAQLEQAEFERALVALERAADTDDLDRTDVVTMYELRALAHVALAEVSALALDLRALASIAPDHRFPPEAPPELQGMLDREAASGPPLAVVAEHVRTGGGLRVDARVENDRAELVRGVRVRVRDHRGRWRTVAPGTIVEASTSAYYAEAIGPGSAVVASRGTEEDPVSLEAAATSAGGPEAWPDPFGRGERDDEGSEDGEGPWLFVGIGAGAAALVGVVIAVILLSGPEGTQPEAPVVLGF